MWKEFRSRIGTVWCGLRHQSLMWPVHGYYECRTCGRRYPAFADAPPANWTKRAAWNQAASLLLLMAVAAFARSAQAAESLKAHAAAEAAVTLQRYTAGAGPAQWAVESVEIEASLPKLEKTGRLRAIRRLPSAGQNRYQVLQLAGDRTVKEQVIVRYLKAEERESELPAGSTAITPANYKFAYKGVVHDGPRLAYAFLITPRRKRDGLIKGEIWLDQQTAVPLLQSGNLVKSPSLFIKRVSVSRENLVRDDVVESRVTHVIIETRLIGRADLVIQERPLRTAEAVEFSSCNTEGGQ